MSMSMREIASEKSSVISGSRALIEGALKIPEELNEAAEILEITGLAGVTRAEPGEYGVYVEGSADFKILYIDQEGTLAGFESSCDFRHSLERREQGGAKVLAVARIGDVNFSLSDSRSISLKAGLHIDLYIMGNEEIRILGSEGLPNSVHVKSRKAEVTSLSSADSPTTYVKSEVRVLQSMPEVKKVLAENGYAAVRKVMVERGKLIVEGELRVFIIYESTDKNAPLQYFSETLPFANILQDPGYGEEDTPFVTCELEKLAAESSEENADVIGIMAGIRLIALTRRTAETELIEDMYDENNMLNVERKQIESSNTRMLECQKKILRLSAEIPANSPEVSRVLYTRAQVFSAEAAAGNDRVALSGNIDFLICYTTQKAGIRCQKMALPFETELIYTGLARNGELKPKVMVEYALAEGSGRELELKVCLDVSMAEVRSENVLAAESYQAEEAPNEEENGIVVYYAGRDETPFEVAKRFRVGRGAEESMEELKKTGRFIFISR